ncbi:MAG: phosphoribosyltransferase family protein [Chryseolinea sp.]
MNNSVVASMLRDFVSLFFPRACVACGDALVKGEETICTYCILELPETSHHLNPDNTLHNRLSPRIPLKHGMACYKFTKNGRVQHLLHALKYKGHDEIGITLGKIYADKIRDSGIHIDFEIIIPVPLHASRLRKRGYNQSAKFAEGLSHVLMIPFSDHVMARKFKTETQTTKSRLSRWENMGDVFIVTRPTEVANKRILLVDDVITTGSTLEACAMELIKAGSRELSIACIAEA